MTAGRAPGGAAGAGICRRDSQAEREPRPEDVRAGTKAINQTFYRLRLLVLIALTTGMRIAEMFALAWRDVLYGEELIAVRSKLKGEKMRYVPMPPELATEIGTFAAVIGEDCILPPKRGATGEQQRVEGSFETILEMAKISDFRFHDLGARSLLGIRW